MKWGSFYVPLKVEKTNAYLLSYTNKIKYNKNLMIVAYKLKESLARSKRDITVYDEVNAEE
jgi:hypothetical protein